MNLRHRLFPTQPRKSELHEELQSHLNMAIADRVAQGESPTAARRSALREFGNVPLVEDVTRQVWGWQWLEQLIQDLRYSIRQLSRARGFTFAVVSVLALGIGANAAIFTLLNGTLLRQLPFDSPDRLVTLTSIDSKDHPSWNSLVDIEQWQQQSRTVESLAYYTDLQSFLQAPNGDQTIGQVPISFNLFNVLGTAPALGRTFISAEQQQGNGHVAILSDSLWRLSFHSDPKILGKTIKIGDTNATVVGVMPRGFAFPSDGKDPQIWTPAELNATSHDRGFYTSSYTVIARRRKGISITAVQAELTGIQHRLLPLYANKMNLALAPSHVQAEDYRARLSKDERPALLALTAAVGIIWLIACANVANLMLARSTTRHRELAVRGALGASRWRLVRQLIIESLLLSTAGSVLGIILARILLQIFSHTLRTQISSTISLHPDLRVLSALLVLSVLSALTFGVTPAVITTRMPLEESLCHGGPQSGNGRNQHTIQRILVVVEIGLSLSMLVACGLLLRTIFALHHVPLGFRTDHVYVIEPKLPSHKYEKLDTNTLLYKPLLERVQKMHGVESAAITTVAPLDTSFFIQFAIDLSTKKASDTGKPAQALYASLKGTGPELQKVLGFSMAKGRYFNEQDTPDAPLVAVVNQAFENSYREITGRSSLDNYSVGRKDGRAFKVIGIIKDFHQTGIAYAAMPEIDLNTAQMKPEDDFYQATMQSHAELAIRSIQDQHNLIPDLQRIMREVNPDLAASSIRSMDQIVEDAMGSQLLAAHLLEVCGGLALAVALMGLYSLLSYLITLRTRELGLRMALGAQREQILTMVLRQAAHLLIGGITLGIAVSLVTTKLLAHFLFGVKPRDIATIITAAILLAATGILAAWLPARRAASIEPMEALRTE